MCRNTLETHVGVWKDEQVCRNGRGCVRKDEQVCGGGRDRVSARAHRRVETRRLRSTAHYDACHIHTYTHAPFATPVHRDVHAALVHTATCNYCCTATVSKTKYVMHVVWDGRLFFAGVALRPWDKIGYFIDSDIIWTEKTINHSRIILHSITYRYTILISSQHYFL